VNTFDKGGEKGERSYSKGRKKQRASAFEKEILVLRRQDFLWRKPGESKCRNRGKGPGVSGENRFGEPYVR